MKLNRVNCTIGLWAIVISVLCSCEKKETNTPITSFSGMVQTVSGDAIEGVFIKINQDTTTTDEQGAFELKVSTDTSGYLISADKFGYGLYSQPFEAAFEGQVIQLTQGTVVEFDPSQENTITDTNSDNNIGQSALLQLDTALLFDVVPRVYDHTGKLIDLGYPEGLEDILDYVKTPRTSRPGMSLRLQANSLQNASGNLPTAGKTLRAAVTTVDFFNPDGMPGNFAVRFTGDPSVFDPDTSQVKIQSQMSPQQKSLQAQPEDGEETSDDKDPDVDRAQLAFMESFGAATIDITDGEESYQLVPGMTATVTIPVYSIRQEKNEYIPPTIPLLHYNETDGVWEVTGRGVLNAARDAYVGEVGHFSVVNFDMVKTGDSKCFKIRQMLVNGANDNTIGGGGTGALTTYRAHLLVPETATSTFSERQRTLDETLGCVPVLGTAMHGVSRLDNTIPYIVAVFSQDGVGATDTLNIAIVSPDPVNSIPAETAVTELNDCTTTTCLPADITNCETSNDAVDMNNYDSSTCTDCWQANCAVIPFDNSGANPSAIVGVPMGGGDVNVKWVDRSPVSNSVQVTVRDGSCGGTILATLLPDLCSAGCFGNACNGGSIVYSGTIGATIYLSVEVYDTFDCTLFPVGGACSDPVTIL